MSTGCETWEATASRSADSAGARESEDLPNAPDTPYPAVSASWTGWTDRRFFARLVRRALGLPGFVLTPGR